MPAYAEIVSSLESDGFKVKSSSLQIARPRARSCALCDCELSGDALAFLVQLVGGWNYVCLERPACRARHAKAEEDGLKRVEAAVKL
jgi:hypothetical protein